MPGCQEICSFYFSCLLALILALGTLYVSFSAVGLLLPDGTVAQRICGLWVIALSLMSLCFHVLGVSGIFRVLPAVAIITVLTAVVRMRGQSFHSCAVQLRNDARLIHAFLSEEMTRFQKLILKILFGIAFCVAIRDCILPPLEWDALTYHAVKAGMWVQKGHVWLMDAPGGWNCFRSYQGGGEAIQAWAMLPFHSDFLVCFVDFVHWFFLLAALYALGGLIGLGRKLSLAGAIFCGYLPIVVFSVGRCDVDLPLALALLAAVMFVAKFFTTSHPQSLLLGFLSLGLAGGIKIMAYPAIVLTVAITALYLIVSRQLSVDILMWFCLSILGMVALMAPWHIYNYVMTGDPFYPFGVSVFGLSWGPKSSAMEWYQNFPLTVNSGLLGEIKAVSKLFYFPPYNRIPNFGVFGLVPLVCFPVGMIKLISRRMWTGMLFLALIAGSSFFFYWPSFSVVRLEYAEWNSRLLLAPLFLATIAVLFAVRSIENERCCNLLLVLSCVQVIPAILFQWTAFDFRYIAIAWAVLLFMVGVMSCVARRVGGSPRKTFIIILCLMLAGVVYCERDHIRYEAAPNYFFIHRTPKYWIDSAKAVDTPTVPRKIAVTAGFRQTGSHWFIYMFLGRALQNRVEYVPSSALGTPIDLRSMFPGTEIGDYRLWLALLHDRGITEIMSFWPRSIEFEWMRKHPESFDPVIQGADFGLFRLRSKAHL